MNNEKNLFIEVEKFLDWEKGYLNYDGKVVKSIEDAQKYDSKEEAENDAALFNQQYGRNGRILARVI